MRFFIGHQGSSAAFPQSCRIKMCIVNLDSVVGFSQQYCLFSRQRTAIASDFSWGVARGWSCGRHLHLSSHHHSMTADVTSAFKFKHPWYSMEAAIAAVNSLRTIGCQIAHDTYLPSRGSHLPCPALCLQLQIKIRLTRTLGQLLCDERPNLV